MDKQIFTIICIVVIGVLAGVMISGYNTRQPLLNELIDQQQKSQKAQELSQKALISLTEEVKSLKTEVAKIKAGAPAPNRPQRPQEDFDTVHKIPVVHSPVVGKKDAPITITEFMDYQCPFCTRFHPVLDRLVKEMPDKVRYVVKNFPLSFHPQARSAAKAAFAANEQGKFQEMSTILLNNGKALNEENYKKWAGELGMDIDKFMKDYKDRDAEWEEKIKKDMELASKIGVRGTPTFFLNGKKTRSRSFEQYKKEIEEILKQ